MFMQWLQYKMMPTFRKQFPGKICIPCCDNAPYHHNRGVPSLSGVTKKADIVKLMREGVPGAGAVRRSDREQRLISSLFICEV